MLGSRRSARLLTTTFVSLVTLGASACDRSDPSTPNTATTVEQPGTTPFETKRVAEPPRPTPPEAPALDPAAPPAAPPAEPDSDQSTPAPPPAEPTPGPVTLEFGAAKIMPADKPELAITLDGEGKVGLGSTPGAMTISADGKVNGSDGKLVAEVGDGGVLTVAGRNTGIVLTTNGLALSAPDGRKVTMVFHPDTGEVVMDPPAGPGMKMVSNGCAAPVTKTCALVLSLYLLAADHQK